MSFPLPLHESRTLGDWTIHAIQAGGQQLDGGAMFGVVPKTLWQKRLSADASNRIPMGMRCLLVEHADELVLIDTGAGNKENQKFHDIYVIENAGAEGRTALEDGVRAAGFTPEDVTLVINTHLHFDHAGGNTFVDGEGRTAASFPNARYTVQRGEMNWATHTNERTGASYFNRNWQSIVDAGKMNLMDAPGDILPGVSVIHTPGHTPFHQSVLLTSNGETACFLGDVCPTTHHLPLPWIMGYDVEPLVTLETKRHLLKRALDEGWLLIFEHDAHHGWGRLAHDG
ncbi:MAG: MBL fold metallo-hydrolase, partial [Gemmatimonadota bacterium]|nr:MBL fold metallo-hydrolase [Gemmatimonadota bacterium]